MTSPILIPHFDPVALAIGPIAIRWYALAYLAGILGGWLLAKRLVFKLPSPRQGLGLRALNPVALDDFILWATLGIVIGGRIGFVAFYNWPYYQHNMLEAVKIWQGGMAFHGGFIGVIVASFLFCRLQKFSLWSFGDLIATVAPVGLFFGRIANFINAELLGRPVDPTVVPWAVVFPQTDGLARHPSQIYQATSEGLVLLVIMLFLFSRPSIRNRSGILVGVFFVGYGVARFCTEFFRSPDTQIGLNAFDLSRGQMLSLPMVAVGAGIIIWRLTLAHNRPPPQST